MRVHDGLIGAGFVLGGAAVFGATLRFPRLEDGAPGPALFPQVLAALMVVFGASLVVSALRARAGGGAVASAAPTPATTAQTRRGVANAFSVFAAIIAFMVVAPKLGFLLTTAGLLFALMVRLGTRLARAAVASIALTLFVWIVFAKVLRVPLPLGVLWF